MRIPLEHFASIPVLTLSPGQEHPSLSGSRRFSMGSAPSSPANKRKIGVNQVRESGDPDAELRPNLTSTQLLSSSLTSFDRRVVDAEYDDDDRGANDETDKGPTSLPFSSLGSGGGGNNRSKSKTSYFQRFSRSRLSQRDVKPNIEESGPQRQICLDCKEMVMQVVRAQSTAKRLQFAKSLFQQQLLTKA